MSNTDNLWGACIDMMELEENSDDVDHNDSETDDVQVTAGQDRPDRPMQAGDGHAAADGVEATQAMMMLAMMVRQKQDEDHEEETMGKREAQMNSSPSDDSRPESECEEAPLGHVEVAETTTGTSGGRRFLGRLVGWRS